VLKKHQGMSFFSNTLRCNYREFKWIYLSVKIFGTNRKRYMDDHFFISFSLKACISRQIERAYIQANIECVNQCKFITLKITTKKRFYAYLRGGNDEKLTRPESLNYNSTKGGGIKMTNTVIIENIFNKKQFLDSSKI
jgi:hypothetical protein